MDHDTLTLIWAAIVAFAVFMYVVMDGFDLGVGILFPYAPHEHDRDAMMNSVAPIWDFNETWMILGAAGLFAAFPLAYAVILPALYLPAVLLLVALIFRGVAFEFRFKAQSSRWVWDIAFHVGSLVAAAGQGIVLGTFIQGIPVENRAYAGGTFDWLTPFSVALAVAMVCGYALLGAAWIIWRSVPPLQDWAYRIAKPLLIAVLVAIALISLWTPWIYPAVRERWFTWPNIAFLSPVPLITAGLALGIWHALKTRAEAWPFVLTLAMFLLSYLGLAISLWPFVIPPAITIWEAASPPESQVFLLVGMAFLIPVILAYTAYSYWVFRGKVRADQGYH